MLLLAVATVVIAFVAVVPSCISASKAISDVTEAIAVASVCVGQLLHYQ